MSDASAGLTSTLASELTAAPYAVARREVALTCVARLLALRRSLAADFSDFSSLVSADSSLPAYSSLGPTGKAFPSVIRIEEAILAQVASSATQASVATPLEVGTANTVAV